jgi:hypothetical protein
LRREFLVEGRPIITPPIKEKPAPLHDRFAADIDDTGKHAFDGLHGLVAPDLRDGRFQFWRGAAASEQQHAYGRPFPERRSELPFCHEVHFFDSKV